MQLMAGVAGELSADLLSRIWTYRYRVFVDTLKWNLKTENGMELDQFDGVDTVYVVSQDDDGMLTGVARLLPTSQPYLLRDVFPQLLNGLPPPCSADVWELSRFAAMDFNNGAMTPQGQMSSPIAIELLRAAISCAAARNAKRLITVSPIGVERLMRRAGFYSHRAGPPMIVDGHPLCACWIELSEDAVDTSVATRAQWQTPIADVSALSIAGLLTRDGRASRLLG
jgi:acyl homoserine lactone synthase